MPTGILKLLVLAALVGGAVLVFIHLLPYLIGILAFVGLLKLWQVLNRRDPPPPNRWL